MEEARHSSPVQYMMSLQQADVLQVIIGSPAFRPAAAAAGTVPISRIQYFILYLPVSFALEPLTPPLPHHPSRLWSTGGNAGPLQTTPDHSRR